MTKRRVLVAFGALVLIAAAFAGGAEFSSWESKRSSPDAEGFFRLLKAAKINVADLSEAVPAHMKPDGGDAKRTLCGTATVPGYEKHPFDICFWEYPGTSSHGYTNITDRFKYGWSGAQTGFKTVFAVPTTETPDALIRVFDAAFGGIIAAGDW